MFLFFYLIASLEAEVFFQEEFNYTWPLRWKQSSAHVKEGKAGKMGWETPEVYYHPEQSKGLKTMDDNKYYHYSCDIGRNVSTYGKPLFIGYTATQTKNQRCAGSYLKFYKEPFDQENFDSDTPFEIMFGHDYCGSVNDQVHCIFNHNNKRHEKLQKVWTKNDKDTHFYGLKIYSNFTFEIYLDLKREADGLIGGKFRDIRPAFDYDESAKKPDDWDDREYIDDVNDTQPEYWDDKNRFIPDPNVTKPLWWNETIDGEWVQPIIYNPKYKGKFTPKQILNPNYTGPWNKPIVRNYDVSDSEYESYCPVFRYVAIDVWQVESGTIFDNIIVTDDPVEFDAFVAATWKRQKNAEKPGFEEEYLDRELTRMERDKEKQKKKDEERRQMMLEKLTDKEIPHDDENDEWYMEDI